MLRVQFVLRREGWLRGELALPGARLVEVHLFDHRYTKADEIGTAADQRDDGKDESTYCNRLLQPEKWLAMGESKGFPVCLFTRVMT